MNEHDAKPWYRQFWPWFLICLPASAVIASLYTVSLAVRTTDSLVVSAEDGMDIVAERHRRAEREARLLGLQAELHIDTVTGAVVATITADKAVDWPKSVELLFSHPAFAYRDQTITLTASMPDADGNPTWSGHFTAVPEGRWYVVLNDGDLWRIGGNWAGASRIELVPASAMSDDSG